MITNANHSFKKILVPVDGSKYSEKALEHACEISKVFDSELVLLYVVEKSHLINLLDRNEYLELLENFGNKTLDKANNIILKKGITAKIFLKKGNIVNEIEKMVKKEKVDLIIVGSKGLGAITRALTWQRLKQACTIFFMCSLLIIK